MKKHKKKKLTLPTPDDDLENKTKKLRMLDAAFVDRADVVLHLGPPPTSARYSMLAASVAELCRARIVRGAELAPALSGEGGGGGASGQPLSPSSSSALLPLSLPEEAFSSPSSSLNQALLPPLAARLAEIAAATEGLSGRSLRRLPFAALADAVGLSGLEEASSSESSSSSSGIDALVFMEALKAAAEAERASRGYL